MIEFKTQHNPTFELVVLNRDPQGNPTGGKRSFTSDSASEISAFWERHHGHEKLKRHKEKFRKKRAANKKAEEIVEGVFGRSLAETIKNENIVQ